MQPPPPPGGRVWTHLYRNNSVGFAGNFKHCTNVFDTFRANAILVLMKSSCWGLLIGTKIVSARKLSIAFVGDSNIVNFAIDLIPAVKSPYKNNNVAQPNLITRQYPNARFHLIPCLREILAI